MRGKLEIKNELTELSESIADLLKQPTATEKKQAKKLIKRRDFLKSISAYLDTDPREEFITSERARIKKSMRGISEKYEHWSKIIAPKNVDPKKLKPMFNKETGLTKLSKQLKTIEYILA